LVVAGSKNYQILTDYTGKTACDKQLGYKQLSIVMRKT
jgi:hypothetical protein